MPKRPDINTSYQGWSREQLLERIAELESKDSIISSPVNKPKATKTKESKRQKSFDFDKYHTQWMAFKIFYLGEKYHGFTIQSARNPDVLGGEKSDRSSKANTREIETIEGHLFKALVKTKLIIDPKNCGYSRCGRTDAGVSALGQVIGLRLRTNKLVEGASGKEKEDELPYVLMLNRELPNDIKVLAYAKVPDGFHARFDCKYRRYKYFFPKSHLDIDAMRAAVSKLIGIHDFRNFCKRDPAKPNINYVRNILHAEINETSFNGTCGDENLKWFELDITGTAFLYHQLVDYLLDIAKCPERPGIALASEAGLVLFECGYESLRFEDKAKDSDLVSKTFQRIEDIWQPITSKSMILQTWLEDHAKLAHRKNQHHHSIYKD